MPNYVYILTFSILAVLLFLAAILIRARRKSKSATSATEIGHAPQVLKPSFAERMSWYSSIASTAIAISGLFGFPPDGKFTITESPHPPCPESSCSNTPTHISTPTPTPTPEPAPTPRQIFLADLIEKCKDERGEHKVGSYQVAAGESHRDSVAIEIESPDYKRWLGCTLPRQFQAIRGRLGVNTELAPDTDIDLRLSCNGTLVRKWILKYGIPVNLNEKIDKCASIRFEATRVAGAPRSGFGAVLGDTELFYWD